MGSGLPQLYQGGGGGGPGFESPSPLGVLPQVAGVDALIGGMDFTAMRIFAIDMINQYGQPVQVIRTTEATPLDPNEPWRVGTGTQTTYSCKAVVSTVKLRASRSGASSPEFYKTIIIPGDIGASTKYGTDGLQLIQTDQIMFAGLLYEWLAAPDPYIYDGSSVMYFSGYAHPLPDASAEGE